MHNFMWGYGYDNSWMFLGWLWMILVLVIPILLLFALGKYLFGRPGSTLPGSTPSIKAPPEKTAVDILKEAYARGEVGREEYLQKLDDLKRG